MFELEEEINENYFTIWCGEIQIDFPDGLGRIVQNSDEIGQMVLVDYAWDLYMRGFSKAEIYVILDGIKSYGFDNFKNSIMRKECIQLPGKTNEAWLALTQEIASKSELSPRCKEVYRHGQLVKTCEDFDLHSHKDTVRYEKETGKVEFYNEDSFVVPKDLTYNINNMDSRHLFEKLLKHLNESGRSHAEIYTIVDGLNKDEEFVLVLATIKEKIFEEIEVAALKNTELKAVGNYVTKDGNIVISFNDQYARKIFPR